MSDSRQGQALTDAGLAELFIPEKERSGAEESEIVERQHSGRASSACSADRCRRDQGKRIVEVRHVRALPFHDAGDFFCRSPIPERLRGEAETRHPLDVVVVNFVEMNLHAICAEHGSLGLEDAVFATRLLVPIMYEEDAHSQTVA